MNRYANLEEITALFFDLKKAKPDLNMVSQFIVGFPSETDSQFRDTLNIMNKLGVNLYHIFPYSDMEDSDASKNDRKSI